MVITNMNQILTTFIVILGGIFCVFVACKIGAWAFSNDFSEPEADMWANIAAKTGGALLLLNHHRRRKQYKKKR